MTTKPKARHRTDGTVGWRIMWRYGGRDGRQQSFTCDSEKDAAVAKAFVEGRRHQVSREEVFEHFNGPPAPAAKPQTTVAQWCAAYVASLTGIEPSTRAEYERIIDQHIRARPLGRLPLAEVTREHVRKWVRAQEPTHSPKTISNHHSVLSAALSEAAALAMIGANPCKGEVRLIAAELPAWCRHVPILLAHTGLRWSELTALQVGDVDLLAAPPTLTVARAWKRQRSGTYAVGAPKTRKSRRTISLDKACVDILAELTCGRAATDWVVTGPDGRALPRSTFASHWAKALHGPLPRDPAKPAGLVGTGMLEKRPRIHDLRHTHASWLLNDSTVSMYRVQRRMGHESITTTEGVYGHLRQDGDVAILAALDGISAPAAVPVS